MGLVAHGQATIVLIGSDSKKSSFAHFLPHVVGELIAVIDVLGDLLGNLSSCELDGPLSQLFQVIL